MKNRVLLVDDDHDIVAGASMRLRAAGYDTSAAYDGETGIATAVETHPDAIVLDIRMPNKTGLETLDELKRNERTRGIPVVMLSASLGDQEAALDGGARFFIKKPYLGSDLVQAINVAVGDSGRCGNDT
jgi:CheY-like chemotaxis protein